MDNLLLDKSLRFTETGYEFGRVGIGAPECQHFLRELFSQLRGLDLVALRLNEVELVHEALQAVNDVWVRFYVELGGQLPDQALLSFICRAVQDSMFLNHSLVNEPLQNFLGFKVVWSVGGCYLCDQEDAVLVAHQE